MSGYLEADFELAYPAGAIIRARFSQAEHRARVTVLFGPSGSGKTTILRCLAGLERPRAGTIRMGDRIWFDAGNGIDLRPQDRGVGFLFQDYALFPHLNVTRNIGYGLSRSRQKTRVSELLHLFGLDGLEARYPHQLSAGQQQRVALARALAPGPKLLLLDEPLSALDAPTRESLRRELRELLISLDTPAVIVTHDWTEAISLADDAVVLSEGTVRQTGPVAEVFSRPADPFVARIVGIETVEPATVVSVSEGLAVVRAGSAELLAVAIEIHPGPAYVCIRGEDVTLERGNPAQTSARNRLAARVTWVVPEGPLVRVGLDCGFALTALITRPSSTQLNVQPGELVTAVIKAPAIHLVPR